MRQRSVLDKGVPVCYNGGILGDRQPGTWRIQESEVTPHFHGGATTFVQTVVYAIVGINLVRLGAAWLATKPRTEGVGRVVGSLVTWGGGK